jgi:recombination protein RecA
MAKEVKTESKKQTLEELVAEMNKELKLDSIQVIGSSKALTIPRLSTGSLTYDICTGGGWAVSRHNHISGIQSSGKSTVSLLTIKKYQEGGDNRAVLMIDAEYSFDHAYALKLGVDLTKVIIIQPDELTQGHDVLMGLLRRDAIGLFIVDSIAALLPKSVIENEADASNIGKHAQAIGNMFKISNSFVGKQKVTALWINQIRDQIGGYGGGTTIPGGKAQSFYASIMIDVFRGSKVDNGDGSFTNRGKIRVTKNKTAPPYQEGEYTMLHGLGIDVSEEVLDWGNKSNVLYKKGHSYYYDDTFINNPEKSKDHVFLGKSKSDCKKFLDDDLDFRDVLYAKILETCLNK